MHQLRFSPFPLRRRAQQTMYATQTLDNVKNALAYGNPELGLTLAKNFFARIRHLELADKPQVRKFVRERTQKGEGEGVCVCGGGGRDGIRE